MVLYNKILRKIDHLLHPAKGEVLMLHRVTSNGSVLEHNRQFEIYPDCLEKTILGHQAKGYLFVSIDDVVSMIKTKRFPNRPFVCFTLDDGYKDNLFEAAPIFRKYNVPYCVYVATSFVTGDVALWWYILEDLIVKNDTLTLTDGRVFSCSTLGEKNKFFTILHDEIIVRKSQKEYFDSLFSNYTYDWRQKAESLVLNMAELQELAKDPLCTIGAHTVNHVNLSQLSYREKQEEIVSSRTLLSAWTGQAISHFSYPYGAYDDECIFIVEQTGFSSAVMAHRGSVRENSDIMSVPRIIV